MLNHFYVQKRKERNTDSLKKQSGLNLSQGLKGSMVPGNWLLRM